jgi:Tfp pilus assembly protein PilN
MIRVNLLPQEYRKAEATPLKQFFATVGAAVLVAGAVVAWLYVRFAVLQPKQAELANITDEIKAQEDKVKLSKDLAASLSDYMAQYEKIDKVAENRLVLSRKVDEFWEAVVNPNPPGRYEVWLKGLTISLSPGGAKSGGTVQFAGISAGSQVAKLSDFHESMTGSEFYRDCQEITYPWGTKIDLPKDREPNEGWDFNFTITLKPLKDLYDLRQKVALEAAGGKK